MTLRPRGSAARGSFVMGAMVVVRSRHLQEEDPPWPTPSEWSNTSTSRRRTPPAWAPPCCRRSATRASTCSRSRAFRAAGARRSTSCPRTPPPSVPRPRRRSGSWSGPRRRSSSADPPGRAPLGLRRVDWTRAREAGRAATWVEDAVRASRLPVACVGVEFGWMWADGAERTRLLGVFDEQCARAKALGAETVMSPVDKGRGDVARAAASVREVGDIAARHGVRLAVEFNSQCEQLNTLERLREVLAKAAHPRCGLLFDAYHMQRSGGSPRSLDDVRGDEIVYVQFSDVPRGEVKPGEVLNRLPPGQGCVPFKEFFAAVRAKGYAGFLSYEAPNPAAWSRPPGEVAREALAATRAVL